MNSPYYLSLCKIGYIPEKILMTKKKYTLTSPSPTTKLPKSPINPQ